MPQHPREFAAAHDVHLQKQALLRRAEERARIRLQEISFVDTRPPLMRSEAFAEDLYEPLEPAAPTELGAGWLIDALMREMAGSDRDHSLA